MGENCITCDVVLVGFALRFYRPGTHSFFYVFISRAARPTPSGGSIFRCTTKDRGERRAKGVATPFNPPGLMRDSKPDVLWLYLLAMVQLTRLSRRRRSAYSLASACCALTVVRQHRRKKYPWGALRWRLLVCSRNLTCHCEPVRTLTSENCKHFCNHQTARFAKRWLFHKCQPLIRSTCSTERQGNKRSAPQGYLLRGTAADLIA